MSGTSLADFTFTAATSIAPGQYNWSAQSNWIQDGFPAGPAVGATAVGLITGSGAYTVNLDFDINTGYSGLSVLEITNASATVALGANNLTLTDQTDLNSNVGAGNGIPLLEYAGTITDAGGNLNAYANYNSGAGTLLVDGAITGFGTIEGNFTGTGSVLASGGTLELTNALTSTTNSFDVGTAAGSILRLDSAAATGVNISFAGASGVLDIRNPGAFAATVSGLAVGTGTTPITNYIDVNTPVTAATLIANTITLFDNASQIGTIALASAPASGSFVDWTTDATLGGTDIFLSSTVCYAAGTHILTDQGEVQVERIREGMRVMTLRGTDQVPMPVTWVGRMRVQLSRHPRPAAAAPVRIRRHALAEDVPHRDLLVSPEHCLFIDGKLFVARSLINGMSIVQDLSWPVVEYFHIETERHAVVLAEGLAAETYLDTGNRAYFDNSGVALLLHPEFTVNAGLRCWAEDACAPLAIAPAEREPVWARLAARARALGFAAPRVETTDDPDLRLVLGGEELPAIAAGPDRYIFLLPRATETVHLRSRAVYPAEVRPWIEDQRRLGVAVSRLVLHAGEAIQEMAPDHPAFTSGWWAPEGVGAEFCRWTDGEAAIHVPPMEGPVVMEVHLRHRTIYQRDLTILAARDRAAA